MSTFKIGKGDTYPSIFATPTESGSPIPLQDCTVTFVMATALESTPKVRAEAVILDNGNTDDVNAIDATLPTVRYDWALDGSDTDADGTYLAEFEIELPSGRLVTCPNDENKKIKVIVGKTV